MVPCTVALWIPLVAGGAVVVTRAVVLALVMPETGFVGPGLGAAEQRNPLSGLAETLGEARTMVRARRVLLLIVIVALTLGFGSEAFDRLWQLHLLDDAGLPGGEPILWLTGLHMAALVLATGAGLVHAPAVAILATRTGSEAPEPVVAPEAAAV